jgi:hypothetical protein
MVYDVKLEKVANCILNILNPRITEFYYLIAIGADQMIVLPVTKRSFVLRLVLVKLMFGYQVAFHQ